MKMFIGFLAVFIPSVCSAQAGSAVQISYGNYLEVASSSSIEPATAMTAEAWVKLNSYAYPCAPVIDKRWSESAEPWSSYSLSTGNDGKPGVMISNGLAGGWVGTPAPSGDPLSLNTWYHVAFTYDKSTGYLNVYVDGALISQATGVDKTLGYSSLTLRIGADAPGDGQFNDCIIDELRIWNVALPQATLQSWKGQSVTASHPYYANLAGYWKFDEGSGTTSADASGNGNTATLVGTPASIWVTSDAPLPVEMTSFTATARPGGVVLAWSTATESANSGFEIERRLIGGAVSWSVIGNVTGAGTSSREHAYAFTDTRVQGGTYAYRLRQIDRGGSFMYSQAVEVTVAPAAYVLQQNYPNPFNPSTTIIFGLPEAGRAVMRVYDLAGREVGTALDEVRDAGVHSVVFDGSHLPSGVYVVRFTASPEAGGPAFTQSIRMVLIK